MSLAGDRPAESSIALFRDPHDLDRQRGDPARLELGGGEQLSASER
jgi:hypothetical protein